MCVWHDRRRAPGEDDPREVRKNVFLIISRRRVVDVAAVDFGVGASCKYTHVEETHKCTDQNIDTLLDCVRGYN